MLVFYCILLLPSFTKPLNEPASPLVELCNYALWLSLAELSFILLFLSCSLSVDFQSTHTRLGSILASKAHY